MVAGISQALGPVIGGIILQYASWRWLFLINIPLGLGTLYFIAAYYKANAPLPGHKDIDIVGTILLAAGLIFTTLALNDLNQLSWFVSGSFLVGILLLIFFVKFEKKIKSPLLDLVLFHNRTFSFISIIRFINMYAAFATVFIIPLFLQNILGKSPLTTGMIIFAFTACYAMLSPFVGRLIDAFGYKFPLIISIFILFVAALLLSFVRMDSGWWLLLLGLALIGVNRAIMLSGSAGLVISHLPKEKRGAGFGAFYSISFLGAILGVSLTGLTVAYVSKLSLIKLLPASAHVSLSQLAELKHFASGALPITSMSHYVNAAQQKLLTPIIQHAFMIGFSASMWLIVFLSLVSLSLSFWLQESK